MIFLPNENTNHHPPHVHIGDELEHIPEQFLKHFDPRAKMALIIKSFPLTNNKLLYYTLACLLLSDRTFGSCATSCPDYLLDQWGVQRTPHSKLS